MTCARCGSTRAEWTRELDSGAQLVCRACASAIDEAVGVWTLQVDRAVDAFERDLSRIDPWGVLEGLGVVHLAA